MARRGTKQASPRPAGDCASSSAVARIGHRGLRGETGHWPLNERTCAREVPAGARQSYVARVIGGILSVRAWSVAFMAGRPKRSRPRRSANPVQSAHHWRHRNDRLVAGRRAG